jgi:ankyrin repeat protein
VKALLDAGAAAMARDSVRRARPQQSVTRARARSTLPAALILTRARHRRAAPPPQHKRIPLHRAVRNGHAATAAALLAAAPESLDACNENGWTALIYASRWGHFELASTLLQAGADVHARTLDERTALSCARDGNHSRVAVLLETAGASSGGGATRACTRMCGF